MLEIPAATHDAILAHCRAKAPNEACGLLSGRSSNGPVVFHPVTNAEPSPVRFVLDPMEHLGIERAAEAAGEQVVAVVHSHPTGDNVPSQTDVDDAGRFDPFSTLLHVLVSPTSGSLRVFRIADGVVEELG